MSASSIAEEGNALEQPAACYTGAGKNDFLPRGQVRGLVNPLRILNTHLGNALLMFGLADNQARQNFSVQAPQRSCGEHAFGSAARAHHGVYRGAAHSGGNAGGKVAIGDKPNARARRANIGDQFFVAWSVEG